MIRMTKHPLLWASVVPICAAVLLLFWFLHVKGFFFGLSQRSVYVPFKALVDQTNSGGGEYQVQYSMFGVSGELRQGGTHNMVKSVIQNVPGRIAWQIDLPRSKSRLEFSLGFLCPENFLPGPIDASITVETRTGQIQLFQRRILVRYDERLFVYYSEHIPLDDFAGERITIIFESRTSEENQGEVKIVWGNPVVVVRQRTPRPNVVLICLDALRSDKTSFINPDCHLTPGLQKLANDGIVFRQAFAQSPWTLPSVSSVLTGVYPSMHGAGWRIALDAYHTFNDLDEDRKQEGMIIGRSRYLLSRLPNYVPTIPEILAKTHTSHMLNGNIVLCPATGIVTRFPTYVDNCWHGKTIVNRAKEWLSANSDKLFFLNAHFMETHEWWKHYGEKFPADLTMDPHKSRDIYDNLVRLGDQYIDQLIHTLKEMDLYDSSLIIFYADHGEHLFDKAWDLKHGHGGTLSNILLKVPLIVKLPYAEYAGEHVDSPVKLLDIFKTILEETGYDTSDQLYNEGVSLRQTFEQRWKNTQRDIISEFMLYDQEAVAFQSGDLRLIHSFDDGLYTFLQVSTDQLITLPDDRVSDAVERRMKQALADYLASSRSRKGQIEEAKFSDAEKEGLKSLGYIQE